MIELKHRGISEHSLTSAIKKIDDAVTIKMDSDIIKQDIMRLEGELGKANNKTDDKNIKALIKHLTRLTRLIKDDTGEFEIGWNVSGGMPEAYPLQLINEPLYKINLSNYITISGNEKLVNIDLKNMADLIAYEYIHRDLGEDHQSMEELLSGIGLVGANEPDILLDKFKSDGDDMYILSQSLMVGDTQYLSPDTGLIYDYFHTKTFDTYKNKYYNDAVNYSCRYAAVMITNSILKKCDLQNIKYKLIAITPISISLIINNEKEINFEKDLMEDITLQLFGRIFSIKPTVTIF